MEKQTLFSYFKKRKSDTNKADYGRALVIAGSYTMSGAAVICGLATIKSGVGICEIACEDKVYNIVASSVPEAVFAPISREVNNEDKLRLKTTIKKASVIVIGCGMGNSDYTDKILRLVLEHAKVPVIIDADAINVLSADTELLNNRNCEVILTPHPKEMSRLIGCDVKEINENRIETATSFSKKYGVVTLLKGHNTVISDRFGEYTINTSGNAGMATGGSGDMLCGIIASLVCEGLSAFDATKVGAYIHGLSGDISAKKYSLHSTSPLTMLECLPQVFLEIERNI